MTGEVIDITRIFALVSRARWARCWLAMAMSRRRGRSSDGHALVVFDPECVSEDSCVGYSSWFSAMIRKNSCISARCDSDRWYKSTEENRRDQCNSELRAQCEVAILARSFFDLGWPN